MYWIHTNKQANDVYTYIYIYTYTFYTFICMCKIKAIIFRFLRKNKQ